MNALIVDDDRFVIASLEKGIQWADLGFSQVYTAYNIQEAKQIIENHSVDFLLSDIDMPNGSGLELLSWLRECHNDLPVIILTNYADFGYAQKAIELKSFYYLLKPIEYEKLTSVISEVTSQLSKQRMERKKNCEAFWRAFLRGGIGQSAENLRRYFSQFHVPYSKGSLFLPVIFDVSHYQLSEDNTLKSNFGSADEQFYYMRTTNNATFSDVLQDYDVFVLYDQEFSRYLAIIQLETNQVPLALRMRCEQFSQLVYAQTKSFVVCYLGIPSSLDQFHVNFAALCSMMANQIDHKETLLDLSNYRQPSNDYISFPTEILKQYLDHAQFAAFRNSSLEYLHRLAAKGCLHENSITSFQLNVEQMLYSFLAGKGVLADKLYNNETYHILVSTAKKSLNSMEMYIKYITSLAEDYFKQAASDKSVALAIKEYVDQHYTEDLFRGDLSDVVYVDAAYAARMFKKEFGVPFKNYIISKRIEVAKELLVTTDLSICTIADSVGYGNYSYFTRIFKKTTGLTPIEYRSQFSTADNGSVSN